MSVNISGLNSSVVRALARYVKSPEFEPRLRFDFSLPVKFGSQRKITTIKILPEHMLQAFLSLKVEFGDEFFKEGEYVIGFISV